MLTKKEKDVLKYFSANDVALVSKPFQLAAESLGITESELMEILRKLNEDGVIKNLRGVINHVQAGYKTNALIAWQISDSAKNKRDDFVKKNFVSEERISHCYQRTAHKNFDYDVFTMMHAKTRKEIMDFVAQTSEKYQLVHDVLFTEKELKKERIALKDLLA